LSASLVWYPAKHLEQSAERIGVCMSQLGKWAMSLASASLSLITIGMVLRLFWEAIKLGWSMVDFFL
jgi:hypothetical protein